MPRILGSRALRVLFALLTLGLVVYAIRNQWSGVAPKFEQLSSAGLAGSSTALLLGMFALLKSWQVSLAGLGSSIRLPVASRVFFIGQLGKYVPGSVWPVVVQMELGKDAGVPRVTSGLTLLYTYLMYPITAALVGAATLPWVTDIAPVWLWLLTTVACAVLLLPPVLNRLFGICIRILRQQGELGMSGRAIARSSGWAVVMWLAFGAHILILSQDLGSDLTWELALVCTGGFTVAWICGFFAFFAPAGGGVRELVLTAILMGTIGREDALAVALVSRLLMTLADLLCAGVGVASLGPAKMRALRARAREQRAADIPVTPA